MSKKPQFNERQQAILDALEGRYARRFETPSAVPTDEDERPPLSSYTQQMQNLLGGEGFKNAYKEAQRDAMTKMLEEANMDAASFFDGFGPDEDPTVVDVMRATNYDSFRTREERYNDPDRFSTEDAKKRALEALSKRFENKFEANKIMPSFGMRLNDLVPKSISENPERLADFEKAVNLQYGLKLDFDDSGAIGDVRTDSILGNSLRWFVEKGENTFNNLLEATTELTQSVYDIFTSGDVGRAGVLSAPFEALESPESVAERMEDEDILDLSGDVFWRSFYVPEAREKYFRSKKNVSKVDFQQIEDGAEASIPQMLNATVDSTLDSAVMLADLAAGRGIAKRALRGATKKIADKAASKVVKRASGRFADPKTGRFISKDAVNKINKRADNLIDFMTTTGTIAATDVLMAGHIHAQNSQEEWYQNLSPEERFYFLAQQSTAETLSAVAFERVLGAGFGKLGKKVRTHAGKKAERSFVKRWGENFSKSFFPGIVIEGTAEAGTAAWQYWSETQARKAGGDESMPFTWNEMIDRVKDAGIAGAAMGGFLGGIGGLTRGGISAYVSAYHDNSIKGNKEIEKAQEAVRKAATREQKQAALKRLADIVERTSGAKGAISRAYYRLSGVNPDNFNEIVELQSKINEAVHRYRKAEGDPEGQETQKRVLEQLIEEKRSLEDQIAKEGGANSFDDFIKEEAEALAKQNKEKQQQYVSERQNSPEAEAERVAEAELDAQRASLDAAQAVNSPEQNADDDVQDQEGKTEGDSKAEREEAQDNSVEGDGDNQFAPSIDEDTDVDDRVKSKYRDVIGTVNNLMQAFKKFGIKVVLHKTSDSYLKATGKTGRGVFFRDESTKTIHMDLEKMATGKEAEGLFGVYDTPVHEFMHLAFTTADVATLKKYKVELLALARQVGLEAEAKKIFDAVDQTYANKNLSEADKLNEQLTNALERLINALPEARKPGFIERAFRSFLRVFGLEEAIIGEQATSTDFLNFIKEFKQARDEGAGFNREEIPVEGQAESADMESRDLGIRQPSKAYPDLINKVVNYRVVYLDKLGGQQSYQTNGLRFNDYWHFRNWYLKETGNGKMADNLAGFTYMGDDGTLKTINPPKPKRDRETGEIIDMEPRLQTPTQRKMATAQSQESRRKKANRYRDIKTNAGKALKFAVGKIEKIGRTGELTFYNDNMLLEQDSQSELPVAYSETFFVDGLNVNDLDQLGKDFGNNLEFLIPTTQEADFAFTVRNNGDGTVTIDAHSNFFVGDQRGDGQSFDGTVSLESKELESVEPSSYTRRLQDLVSRVYKFVREAMPLSDLDGENVVFLPFDRTGKFSGISNVIANALRITAHVDAREVTQVRAMMIRAAKDKAKRLGLKEGDVGYIYTAHPLLGAESSFGNPEVFKSIIKELATDAEILKALKLNLKKGEAGRSNAILNSAIAGSLVNNDLDLYNKLVDVKDEGASLDLSTEEISLVRNALITDLAGKDSTFDSRKKRADDLIRTKKRRSELAKEVNDKFFSEEFINPQGGEVIAATKVPFIVLEGGKIGGFEAKFNQKEAFPGVIDYKQEDFGGADHEAPSTRFLSEIAHISDLLPDEFVKISEETVSKLSEEALASAGVTQEVVKKKDGTEERVARVRTSILRSELDPQEARDIIREQFAFRERNRISGLVSTEGVTRDVKSQQSIDLGLNTDNESNLPFEPNNLNAFQAFMARMDQLFANKYANVFSLQRAVEGAKKAVVDISQDFINAETLMYGKTANDLEKLDEKVKVISQEMKDAGLIGEDVSQFLIARHAEERNALIAERTDGETLDGSGMSNERAQEVMDSFSPEQKAALDSIAKKVDAITKDTRKTMVKFGLETQETIDAFEEMFDNYVPLGGLSVDEMSADTSLYPTGGAGMSIYGDTTRRARGRASEANNVLAQAIAQNAAVHAKARKNEALSSLYNLVENNPNTKVWKISNEVPFDAQSAVGVRVNGEQKFIVFTNPDHAKALKNMGVEKLDLFSKIMRSFSGFLRRSFTTANPEFIISNFARDIQSALFNAMAEADIPGGQIQSKYIATKIIERVKQTLPALLKGAVGKDLDPEMAAYFEDFKEDGGQTGWGFVKDVGTIAAEIEAEVNEKNKAQKARDWMMKNSIDVVENVNDAFENSIRLAAYMEARKAGTSREKAAELAKNITVNFNRSGELGAVANAWYMFFNASVQGTVRLARSLGTLKDVRKPNGELESWHKRLNASQKMAFGLSLTTGMLTAINLAMSDEDEDGVLFYNKIPDYEKERNLIIMYDGQNYLKIPLPYGFNVFANMGSAMAEVAGGQRDMTDAGMFLLNSAFSSFSPVSFGQSKDAAKYLAKGATPTIFKPLVDIAVNESYFGSSVYKEQFPVGAPKPEAEMSFRAPEGVRSFFKWMNEATGGSEFVPGKADFNPDKFWYGFEYYIGGAGQFVTRTLGTGRDAYEMIKEGEKVPMKANDFPFLRKLYGEFSKYYDSDVYVENANTVSQLYKERKEADNKSDKRYRGIMKLESSRKRTEKQIKRLRQLRKEARDIKNYVERQNRIYELYEKERSLLMQFNKQFEQLRGQD